MSEVSRRAVARGAIWSVPVLAVAASAPAVAASCTPTTVSKSVTLQWVSTLLDFSATADGSDQRLLRYTFTNEGPDDIPAQVKATLRYTITLDSSDWTTSCEVVATSTNATSSMKSSGPDADADGHLTYHYEITVASTQDIAKDETFSMDVRLMYGLLAGASGDLNHPEESVTMESPQAVTDTTTCVTANVAGAIEGADDDTTWSYP